MKFQIQVTAISDSGDTISQTEIVTLKKDFQSVEHLGLSLTESKEILNTLQKNILEHQVEAYLESHSCCQNCDTVLKIKGHHDVIFGTLFGNFSLESPRLKHCQCIRHETVSFSPLPDLLTERFSPELLFMQSKWASLVPYGKTVNVLKDFLPVNGKLNTTTIRRKTLEIARQCEDKLGEEKSGFIDGCPRDWEALPPPDGPITVGIDGGYLQNWADKKKNFEVIVGKSMPSEGPLKYLGFVQRYDKKSKRRLFEVLKSQGMQHNQEIIFLADGEEALSWLQRYLNPNAYHVLDWFHVTMRITVLLQYAKGLINVDPNIGEHIRKDIESAKWNLWHGRPKRAYNIIADVGDMIYDFEKTYPKFKKLEKFIDEFLTYIKRNSPMIPNYGKIWRAGYPISTAFVESTVNSFLAKRFSKKQQMQWSEEGVHLLIQIRSKTLNGELINNFKDWYPDLIIDKPEQTIAVNQSEPKNNEIVKEIYTFEYQEKGGLEYWSLPDVEEEFEDPMDCDEFLEALNFHSELIQFFIDLEALDDIDLVKLRQDIAEKFPQERVENTRATFKRYSSVS